MSFTESRKLHHICNCVFLGVVGKACKVQRPSGATGQWMLSFQNGGTNGGNYFESVVEDSDRVAMIAITVMDSSLSA